MGAVLMFILYAATTNLPIVKACTPEWKAVCATIMNKCRKIESKIAANIVYLSNEADVILTKTTRQLLSKLEVYDRLLVDIQCVREQAELLGLAA